MASNRVVRVSLLADVNGFMANLARARAATTDFARGIAQESQRNKADFEEVGQGVGAVGIAAAAGVGVAIAKFAEFDQQMSFIQAATHETAGNMDLLRQAAVDAGASTVYSATEAGGAIEELAKAGISTTDVLSGGLSGSLDLAAAGGLEVADAATIAATALTQFGLSGADIPHVADLLAAGAGKAQGSVQDLGAALNQSGLVANQTGLTIEETTGTLAAFAAAGLTGSDAGTSFKTMLQALTPSSDEARETMDALGIAAYDAQGNFIGMEKFAGVLKEGLSGLSKEQQNAALKTIFGADAVRAASVIFENGSEGIAKWVDAVDDSGYAADTAAQRLDNLQGDLEGLGGAFDTVMIGIGSQADGASRAVVQMATAIVQSFTNMTGPSQALALQVGGLITVFGLVGGAALVAIPKLVAFKVALETLSKEAPRTAAAVGKVKLALVGLTGLAVAAWAGQTVSSFIDSAQQSLGFKKSVDELYKSLDKLQSKQTITAQFNLKSAGFDTGVSGLQQLTNMGGFSDALKFSKEAAANFSDFMPVLKLLGNGTLDTTRKVQDLDKAMAQLVADGKTEEAAAAWTELKAQTDGSRESMDRLKALFPEYSEAAKSAGAATSGAAASNEELGASSTAAAEEIIASQEALSEWRQMIAESDGAFISLQGAMDSAISKQQEFAQSSADASESSEDSWEDFYDGHTFSVQQYLDELQAQVDAQTNWETNMLVLSGRVSQGMIDDLARLGPEGAPLVAALVNASDEELTRMEGLYGQKATDATGAFTSQLELAKPVIAAAGAQLGQATAQEIAGKLAAGTSTVQQIIDEYGIIVETKNPTINVDTSTAAGRIAALRAQIDSIPRYVGIQINTDNTVTYSDARNSAKDPNKPNANGGLYAFANGGIPTGVYAGRPGSIYKFAEPETRWEAFISGKPGQERRNIGIWADAGKRLGVLGGSNKAYASSMPSMGAQITRAFTASLGSGNIFYGYYPKDIVRDLSRKQSQALALYGDD